MSRVLLSHQTGSIELPEGETLVGRGLSCSIRFNDPGISRQHVRIMVDGTSVTLEELRSTNGTRINGQRIEGITKVQDGDELQIGFHWLHVHILANTAQDEDEETQTGLTVFPGSDGQPDHDVVCVLPPQPPDAAQSLPSLDKVTCPHCRTLLDASLRACPACGQGVQALRHRSVTQPIAPSTVDRRAAPRYAVDIPLLYSSDTLTFDSVARDLSVSGIFVASELLDPVGTRCSVTILPDGSPSLSLVGVVCRVIEHEGGAGGRPPGLGVKFDALSEDIERWLEGFIDRCAPR
jgi:predicted component of type VI protein secretion system